MINNINSDDSGIVLHIITGREVNAYGKYAWRSKYVSNQDNKERFLFWVITPAAAYVFRPTKRSIGRLVFKCTDISKTTENV